jgi:hypothetical protein
LRGARRLGFCAILGGEYDKFCEKAFYAHFLPIDGHLVLFSPSTRFPVIWVAAEAASCTSGPDG